MDIIERRLLNIEADIRNAETRRHDFQFLRQRLVRVLKTFQVENANAGNVYFVILVQSHRLATREIEHHLVDICRLSVEVVVALQNQMLTNFVLFQYERSRRVGTVSPGIATCFDIRLVHHECRRISELRKEVRLGRVNGDFKGTLVDGFDAAYLSCLTVQDLCHAQNVTEVGSRHRGCQFRVRGAVEGIHEVLRRYGLAVREGGVWQQVEGIDHPIIAYIPPLRDVRHYLQVRIQGNQTTEYFSDDKRRRGVRCLVWIKGGRISEEPRHRTTDRLVSLHSGFRFSYLWRSGRRCSLDRQARWRRALLSGLLSLWCLRLCSGCGFSRPGLSRRRCFRFFDFALARAASQSADRYREYGYQ